MRFFTRLGAALKGAMRGDVGRVSRSSDKYGSKSAPLGVSRDNAVFCSSDKGAGFVAVIAVDLSRNLAILARR